MQRFDEMSEELARYGVSIVALSKDTVDEAAVHKKRDSLSFMLLSDEQLQVIRQFGVEHHKAFGFKTDGRALWGLSLSFTNPSIKAMAIPTTLIVDETGTIRWIDQADDYRIRSDNDRVFDAVQSLFSRAQPV